MDIGVVIKKYRKEAGMTQEEMANRLGVTTPAVNKWENSNSKPDIELLAPIARLLDISLDTLLSYHEYLLDTEIEEIIRKDYSGSRGKSKKHMKMGKGAFRNCRFYRSGMSFFLIWKCSRDKVMIRLI